MNKKIISAGMGVIVLVIVIISFTVTSEDKNGATQSEEKITAMTSDIGLGITYTDANYELKQILQENDISMSSPIKLDDLRAIWSYCNLFEGDEQKLVEYCTSTELKDSDENFLGNIHAVGTPVEPKLIMALIQVDPFLNQKENAKTVFSVLVDHIVCDCWHTKNIQGKSLDELADEHIEFHISGGKPTSKSSIIPLEGRSIQMELTTNSEGYLWKLFVTA
ncbi:MAG: hypothetical protein ACE5RJ_03230 [Nitrosopumilaceae archaeon]